MKIGVSSASYYPLETELALEEIGKSGINHRLRKLSEIAEELRGNKEEQTW